PAAGDDEIARIDALLRSGLDSAAPGRVADEGAYVDHVAAHTAADVPALGAGGALEAIELGDMALAFAAATADRQAVRRVEHTMVEAVPKSLTRLRPDPRLVDEVKQSLREKLLVGAGGRPKLLDYKGRGPLAAWVRVVALRLAYEALRQ